MQSSGRWYLPVLSTDRPTSKNMCLQNEKGAGMPRKVTGITFQHIRWQKIPVWSYDDDYELLIGDIFTIRCFKSKKPVLGQPHTKEKHPWLKHQAKSDNYTLAETPDNINKPWSHMFSSLRCQNPNATNSAACRYWLLAAAAWSCSTAAVLCIWLTRWQ